jgi:AraC family transcriptional regulator
MLLDRSETLAGCDRRTDQVSVASGTRQSWCPWDRREVTPTRRRGLLASTPAGMVGLTRCRPVTAQMGQEYSTDTVVVSFPIAGAFELHTAAGSRIADVNSAVMHNPAEPFRTSHPEGSLEGGRCGDDCVWTAPTEATLRDAFARHGLAWDPRTPFPALALQTSAPTFMAVRDLLRMVARPGGAEPIAVQEAMVALFDRLAADVAAAGPLMNETARRDDTLRAHRRCAEDVKRVLVSRFRTQLDLEEISRSVHVSPFHLCRVFKSRVGVPIHRYLNRLRLREAYDTVSRGCTNLATLADGLGFSSHSHFTESFRKEFGRPPSAVRTDGIADPLATALTMT